VRGVLRIIFLIPAAFIAASLAGAAIIVLSVGWHPQPYESQGELLAKLVFLSFITSMFVGMIAGVPALIMIVLAEVFSWRSVILHLVVGAGIGFVAFLLGIGGEPPASAHDLRVGGAAGAVAGFVYWAIAGRSAGLGEGRPEDAAVKSDTPPEADDPKSSPSS